MFIHPSAEVEADVTIGDNTKVWHLAHIRRNAHLGANCVIGRGVFVDAGVQIGRDGEPGSNGAYDCSCCGGHWVLPQTRCWHFGTEQTLMWAHVTMA